MSIEYLGHIFNVTDITNNFIHTCDVCKVQAWHNVSNVKTLHPFYVKAQKEDVQYNVKLNLTCEEMQIKNILE